MVLIADSGSTKTDWRLISSDGSVSQAKTAGFNPYFQDTETIYTELKQHLVPEITTNAVREVYYYGAGCSTETNQTIVQNAINQAFPRTYIEVTHDMLAAARALCGHEPGIACILGTGVNSCLYDGKQIVAGRPSLGFWLGDEGSGGYMGKTLVQHYFHEDMPADLRQKFEKRYTPVLGTILENAYKKPFPNAYFASFSKFLFDNLNHPYCYQLAYDGFVAFFNRYVCKYENYKAYKVHFVGSVAFYYSNVLRQVANDKGITLQYILESPISGLTLYHQQKLKETSHKL
ncbi:N-acetylglucosamine kinase [Rhodocytophaga rosea]|uniref:N-acetylglucosamine kinase n=1 Tax=Rhodocytophaga rosea TaxID=2704465 RepID=A0A6C0GQI6_9BACT|nr:N-acetylglucosamine kinase [Rhodocytophaga rosea]QHT69873.1 N-acetylglucosamine kinase [Rhodocytophaga rosea]